MTHAELKSNVRQQVRKQLGSLSEARRAEDSGQARTLLAAQDSWKNAASVLFYAPVAGEVDIWPLLTHALSLGKTVALPRFESSSNCYVACAIQDPARDLQAGQFGIREPNEHCGTKLLNRLDLILVPGIAFDLTGRRLGRGKGFYDQLLAVVNGRTCGVAFEEQLVDEVPVEAHDIRLDFILTPKRWLEV